MAVACSERCGSFPKLVPIRGRTYPGLLEEILVVPEHNTVAHHWEAVVLALPKRSLVGSLEENVSPSHSLICCVRSANIPSSANDAWSGLSMITMSGS